MISNCRLSQCCDIFFSKTIKCCCCYYCTLPTGFYTYNVIFSAFALSILRAAIFINNIRASDISRKKKQNFAGFPGVNSRKNRPISRENSQNSRNNRPMSVDFRRRKVKIRRKIGPFRRILVEKSQFSKDFQGQILRKIGRFHRKFRGETSPRNNQ